MLTMEYRMVDILKADQLEVGDLIGLGDEIVEVVNVKPHDDGFTLTFKNDFDEKDEIEISYDQNFGLFVDN